VSILEPVERGIEAVNRFRPHILRSYGSYLEALFLRLRETGEPFHRPALVVYGADAMPQRARRLIEDGFGIPVLGVYGAYEARHLGFECSARRGFHINTDVYPVRIVDRAGDDVPLGATGEVVVSNLINRATMLLNYRLGDAAAWVPGPCPCGRTLPVLTYVEGRIADWLVMPGGERLHPQTVTVVLEMDPEILRYQVVQSGPDALTVRLVTRSGSDRTALSARVQRELSAVFRGRLAIQPEFVEDLPRTARGKVRTVVGLRTGR
jgi:phenylacetate-CoA ligase